jgi:hypothetical protein
MLDNKVPRRIFGLNMDGITGGWRRLHSQELHNLYASSDIITVDHIKKNKIG